MIATLFVLLALAAPDALHPVSTAEAEYQNLWSYAAHLYGAEGQPAPLHEFLAEDDKKTLAYVCADEGLASVKITPFVSKWLTGSNPLDRKMAYLTLLHEWAHVYQARWVHLGPMRYQEGFAEWFAREQTHRLFHLPYWVMNSRYYTSSQYRRWAQGLENKTSWIAAKRQQFGSYYGDDPTQISVASTIGSC